MVVALDLHGHSQATPDVYDAGILAGALEHPCPRGGETPELRDESACSRSARST